MGNKCCLSPCILCAKLRKATRHTRKRFLLFGAFVGGVACSAIYCICTCKLCICLQHAQQFDRLTNNSVGKVTHGTTPMARFYAAMQLHVQVHTEHMHAAYVCWSRIYGVRSIMVGGGDTETVTTTPSQRSCMRSRLQSFIQFIERVVVLVLVIHL